MSRVICTFLNLFHSFIGSLAWYAHILFLSFCPKLGRERGVTGAKPIWLVTFVLKVCLNPSKYLLLVSNSFPQSGILLSSPSMLSPTEVKFMFCIPLSSDMSLFSLNTLKCVKGFNCLKCQMSSSKPFFFGRSP